MHRTFRAATLTLMLLSSSALAQTAPSSMPAMPVMPQEPAAASVPVLPAVPGAPRAAVETLPEVNVPSVAPAPALPLPQPELSAAAPAALPQPGQKASLPVVATPQDLVEEVPVMTVPSSETFNAEGADYSFGTTNISLLYTPNQAQRMKSVLTIYENARRNRTNTQIEIVEDLGPELDDLAPPVIEEPATYPVFTLKSIAYRNGSDWTVWIGDYRLTPRNNDQEVRVLAVSANAAQLMWKPVYRQALQQRANMKLFAKPDAVSHKATKPNTAILDAAAGQVTFTLRPNQSFAPGYMATFEGKVAAPALPALSDDAIDKAAEAALSQSPQTPAGNDANATNPGNLDALLRAQQQSQRPSESLFRQSLGGRGQAAPQSAPPSNQ